MDTTKRGLTCSIYLPRAGSASNGGISSRCDEVTLIDIGAEIFEPTPERPAVCIVSMHRDYVCAVPVPSTCGGTFIYTSDSRFPAQYPIPMFGGCFIYSSDSRFPAPYPIPLHDRFETQEEYDLLSR